MDWYKDNPFILHAQKRKAQEKEFKVQTYVWFGDEVVFRSTNLSIESLITALYRFMETPEYKEIQKEEISNIPF